MPLRIDAITAQHIGDRNEQQDRVLLRAHKRVSGTALAVLADGAGGYKGGAAAAEQVLRTAAQLFERWSPRSESARELLAGIVNEAHTVIRLNRVLTEEEPHSTVIALLLQPQRVDWVHVGDSRLYHFANRELRGRTRDHSLVEVQIQQGQWPEAERHRHPHRNMLLQALGHSESPQPDFGTAPARPGDTFLLCSDGLWEYHSDAELAAMLDTLPPRQAAESLLATARARALGRGDNISLAIVRLLADEAADCT